MVHEGKQTTKRRQDPGDSLLERVLRAPAHLPTKTFLTVQLTCWCGQK